MSPEHRWRRHSGSGGALFFCKMPLFIPCLLFFRKKRNEKFLPQEPSHWQSCFHGELDPGHRAGEMWCYQWRWTLSLWRRRRSRKRGRQKEKERVRDEEGKEKGRIVRRRIGRNRGGRGGRKKRREEEERGGRGEVREEEEEAGRGRRRRRSGEEKKGVRGEGRGVSWTVLWSFISWAHSLSMDALTSEWLVLCLCSSTLVSRN